MLILVVGKLTRTEQRMITRIKKYVKNDEKKKIKTIIIVHNLAQFHKKIEVEKYIENYLKCSATFRVETRDYLGDKAKYKSRQFLYEVSKEFEGLSIFHHLMAKEGTEAGEYYNPFTLDLIKEQFNNFNERKAINKYP